jgi:hypothetical protein
MIFSFGSCLITSLATVKPPTPESITPIACFKLIASFNAFPDAISLSFFEGVVFLRLKNQPTLPLNSLDAF